MKTYLDYIEQRSELVDSVKCQYSSLIEVIAENSKARSFKERSIINIKRNSIIFPLTGVIEISLNGIVIAHGESEFPLGIMEDFNLKQTTNLKYKALTDVSAFEINSDVFWDKLHNTPKHMKILSNLQSYAILMLLDIYSNQMHNDYYNVVSRLIKRYAHLKKRGALAHNIKIVEFIDERSTISKGYIFKVLNKMKKERIITIDNGILSLNNSADVENGD